MTAHSLTPEQMAAVNDSDVLCCCGADPRKAASLAGWFIDLYPIHLGRDVVTVATVRCPECW